MKHAGTKLLETERLILRPYQPDDAEMMFRNWAGDDRVTKYLTWPTHTNIEVTRSVLAMWVADYEKPETYHWGITDRETGELFGDISVVHQEEETLSAEIGYCMSAERWGKGYMPEAGKAVIRYLFTNTDFCRIAAYHDTNNPNSGKVMKKLGMQFEGISHRAAKNNQGIVDIAHYAILKEEFREDR